MGCDGVLVVIVRYLLGWIILATCFVTWHDPLGADRGCLGKSAVRPMDRDRAREVSADD
jgi:hypothetical protein